MREKAEALAATLLPLADFVTVIYSNPEEAEEEGTGEWIKVPNEYFFGRKFREALKRNKGDIFLNIQADASSSEWEKIFQKCREAYAQIPRLGVWQPNLDWTWWTTDRVRLGNLTPELAVVAQTDGITFAVNQEVVSRLLELDYDRNNLGWGVEWAAIVYAYSHNLLVLRDTSVKVLHPKGSGYDHTEARKQQDAFLDQLSPQEKLQYFLLYRFVTRT